MNKKILILIILIAATVGLGIIALTQKVENDSTIIDYTDVTKTPNKEPDPTAEIGDSISSLSDRLGEQTMTALRNNIFAYTGFRYTDFYIKSNSYVENGETTTFFIDTKNGNLTYAIEIAPAEGETYNNVYVTCAPPEYQIDRNAYCTISEGEH